MKSPSRFRAMKAARNARARPLDLALAQPAAPDAEARMATGSIRVGRVRDHVEVLRP